MTEARAQFDEAQGVLIASGAWHAESAAAIPNLAGKAVRVLDGAGVTQLDTNGAWLLLAAACPRATDPLPELRAFQPRHLALLKLVAQHDASTTRKTEHPAEGLLELTGRGALAMWGHILGPVDFVGRLSIELMALMPRPGSWRWREFGAQVRAVFVGAIPIVAGMLFLLGVVSAYLLGSQAQQ